MKTNVISIVIAFLTGATGLASGSMNYVCWQNKVKGALGSVRYEYVAGEEVEARLWRVAGVDQKAVEEALLKYNETSLDAFTVLGLLTKSDEVVLSVCAEDDKACLATDGAAEIKDEWTVLTNQWKTKYNNIVHTASLKDGTKITLTVHNFDTKDSDGEYEGTLAVESPLAVYKSLGTIPVSCAIATP